MKVVWIVNEYNFPNGNNTRQTNLCRRLNERGYDCYIISGSSSTKGTENKITDGKPYLYIETDEAKGYMIRTANFSKTYERALVALRFQHKLWKLRNKLPKPDVIVSDFAGFFGNIFLKWKKKYGTKIIYDILDLWPEGFVDMGYLKKNSPITKALYRMEHKSYREADGIIFSMQGGRDYIVDKGWSREVGGDVDTSDIGYLNNGVNLEIEDAKKEQYVLEDPDLDTDKKKFIYLGSVSAFNGLDILVETARVLQERKFEDAVILVYGFGNRENKLRKMAADYGLTNIKFKGRLDKNYAMSLLTQADVNVFTFTNTGLLKYGVSPNKLFMYFASGKPVLSMIRPAYDLVEEKKAGISVENDPEIVADAIVRFCSMDGEEYTTYCQNARETAEEYDYKNLVQVLIDKIEGA
ncbi:MAG: glycosyltransferase family 4 protein [Oscillospiraceae bacterium]|nr:glycosyltransferase family 4 protein [Oscillospiraceae bacterium]